VGWQRPVLLAEFFRVVPTTAMGLFDGDLSRLDRVGWQLAGRIHVDGNVGHYAGGCMSAGELLSAGAGLLAACEMAGGIFTAGDVDDFAASTCRAWTQARRHPSSSRVRRCAIRDRMRRGSAIVHGDAGDSGLAPGAGTTPSRAPRSACGLGHARGSVVSSPVDGRLGRSRDLRSCARCGGGVLALLSAICTPRGPFRWPQGASNGTWGTWQWTAGAR
jgi:formylmethanofuran dehydrogenase subunit C